jgi:DNA-binding phage protein
MKQPMPWNIQDYLKTNKDRVNYLEAALEENDKEYMAIALMNIAQSLGLGATIYVKSVEHTE